MSHAELIQYLAEHHLYIVLAGRLNRDRPKMYQGIRMQTDTEAIAAAVELVQEHKEAVVKFRALLDQEAELTAACGDIAVSARRAAVVQREGEAFADFEPVDLKEYIGAALEHKAPEVIA